MFVIKCAGLFLLKVFFLVLEIIICIYGWHLYLLLMSDDCQLQRIKRIRRIGALRKEARGHLGGSVGWASDSGPSHDLTVHGFKPRVGLCADGSKPGTCFTFCVSLSLCPSAPHALSLSPSKINVKKKERKEGGQAWDKLSISTSFFLFLSSSPCHP